MLMAMGQLKAGMEVSLDFDRNFIPAEKNDANTYGKALQDLSIQ